MQGLQISAASPRTEDLYFLLVKFEHASQRQVLIINELLTQRYKQSIKSKKKWPTPIRLLSCLQRPVERHIFIDI